MRRAATAPPGKDADELSSRVERDIIGVLLGLMGAAALWWAGTWWWRAGHAQAVPAPRPPTVETATPPAPLRFDRRRAQTLALAASRGDTDAVASEDGGVHDGDGTVSEPPAPGRVSYGLDRGHGSESWSRSDAPEREDFEPRYSLDAGTFAEPSPIAADAPRAFH